MSGSQRLHFFEYARVSDVTSLSADLRPRRIGGGLLFPLTFLLFLSSFSQAAPELILTNARILVVDASFSEVEAIAIENGRIYAIGRSYAVQALAGTETRVLDMQGRTIIPGLIDNHIHAVRAAQLWRHEVRLDGINSYAEALERISEKAGQSKPGEWVLVRGGFVEHQFLDQPDGFRLVDLDRAAPENPVYIQHLFDWGYVNSLALERVGIDASVAHQKRSGLLLDDDGLPNGAITRATQQAVVARLPDPTLTERQEGARKLFYDLNSRGVTTVLDAGGFDTLPDYYQPFRTLNDQNALTVRLHYLHQLIPWEKGFGFPPDMSRLKNAEGPEQSLWLRRIGVGEQIYLPVQDSAGRPAGASDKVKESFRKYVARLAERGIHIHLHAVNDKSINQHLDIFDPLTRAFNLRALRWTFAHADGIRPETMERVRDLGFNIAIHARPWLIGYRFQRQFGAEAAQMTPMRTLTALKVPWGLGSDSPVVGSINPFHTLHWAVNGTMVDGRLLSEQTVTRQQALVAHTRSNARLLFAENYLGTLEPGKRADLVVLDKDYMAVDAEQIRTIRPLATMVDGRWVYKADEYRLLDAR